MVLAPCNNNKSVVMQSDKQLVTFCKVSHSQSRMTIAHTLRLVPPTLVIVNPLVIGCIGELLDIV